MLQMLLDSKLYLFKEAVMVNQKKLGWVNGPVSKSNSAIKFCFILHCLRRSFYKFYFNWGTTKVKENNITIGHLLLVPVCILQTLPFSGNVSVVGIRQT